MNSNNGIFLHWVKITNSTVTKKIYVTSTFVKGLNKTILAAHIPKLTGIAFTTVFVHSCDEYNGNLDGAPPSS